MNVIVVSVVLLSVVAPLLGSFYLVKNNLSVMMNVIVVCVILLSVVAPLLGSFYLVKKAIKPRSYFSFHSQVVIPVINFIRLQ